MSNFGDEADSKTLLAFVLWWEKKVVEDGRRVPDEEDVARFLRDRAERRETQNEINAISGEDVRRLMRRHHRTIRDLANQMLVTQKRVRDVREKGVTGAGFCLDWIEAISRTSKDTTCGWALCSLCRRPDELQRHQDASSLPPLP